MSKEIANIKCSNNFVHQLKGMHIPKQVNYNSFFYFQALVHASDRKSASHLIE